MPPERVRVTSAPLSELTFFPAYSAPAKVISLNDSQISAQLQARILSMPVRVGETVKKDQLLAQLECRDAEFTQAAAQSRLKLARKELARLQKLKRASAVTEQNLNRAETDLQQADISYGQARLQVSRCEVRAPFNGVVTARQGAEGELANPGTPLLSLTDTDNIEVVAEIPPAETPTLSAAKRPVFSWNSRQHPVALRALSPVLNPANRSREIRLLFSGLKAPSGSAGRIRWHSGDAYLPTDMLLQRDGQTGVFVIKGDKAHFVVLPDAQPGKPASVNLAPDTRIILDGRFGLKDGDLIEQREL